MSVLVGITLRMHQITGSCALSLESVVYQDCSDSDAGGQRNVGLDVS